MNQIEYVQIYGERNSGTNYLHQLMEGNFSGIQVGYDYGWKHGQVHHNVLMKKDTDNVLFLAVIKDPYSWIVSMSEKPHHAPQLYRLQFSDFIRREWACYKGKDYQKRDVVANPVSDEEEMLWERDPETKQRFKNVVLLRNSKTRSFLRVATWSKNFMAINYEKLLEDPQSVLQTLAQKFQINLNPEFKQAEGYYGKNPNLKFEKKDFYAQKQYFNAYNQEDLDYVNQFLDAELEKSLGYKLIINLPVMEASQL